MLEVAFGAKLPGPFLGGERVDQLVIGIHAERAMGRQAFDGKGTGDADLLFVVVGFVVEKFRIGLGGDGGVSSAAQLNR